MTNKSNMEGGTMYTEEVRENRNVAETENLRS